MLTYTPTERLKQFLASYFYASEAFLIDEIVSIDVAQRQVQARAETTRPFLVTPYQRGAPEVHPRHVSGADLMVLTTNLGALHAYFIHGCRWDDGWVGFGGRIYQADFKRLVTIGAPLELFSREVRTRKSSTRIITRYEFSFYQDGQLVYYGDQIAQFIYQTC